MELKEIQKEYLAFTLSASIRQDIKDAVEDTGIYGFVSDAMLLRDYMLNMTTLDTILDDIEADIPHLDNDDMKELHETYVKALEDDLEAYLNDSDQSWQHEDIAVLYLLGEKDLVEKWSKAYGYSEKDYMETVQDIKSMTYGSSLEKMSDLIKEYDVLRDKIGLNNEKEQEIER